MNDIRFDGNLDLPINNIGYVSVSRNENYIFEYRTGKERYSFIYVESGELKYYFPNTNSTIKINAGTLLFIPKKTPYKTTYLKHNTILKILVFDILAENMPVYLATPFSRISSTASSIFNSISMPNLQNTIFLSSKIYGLIFHVLINNSIIPEKYSSIIPAIKDINMHYQETKKISYYAELCHMSESNFRLLFKQYTGKTPIEYRNCIRISEAIKLIGSQEFNVSEAARLTGFNNMSHFYESLNKSRKIDI